MDLISLNNKIKLIFATLLPAFQFIFVGNIEIKTIYAVLVLFILDTTLGISVAYKRGKSHGEGISSRKATDGMTAKVIKYMVLFITGTMLDYILPMDFMAMAMLGWIASSEAISIFENLYLLGFKALPQHLLERLLVYNNPNAKIKKDG